MKAGLSPSLAPKTKQSAQQQALLEQQQQMMMPQSQLPPNQIPGAEPSPATQSSRMPSKQANIQSKIFAKIPPKRYKNAHPEQQLSHAHKGMPSNRSQQTSQRQRGQPTGAQKESETMYKIKYPVTAMGPAQKAPLRQAQ